MKVLDYFKLCCFELYEAAPHLLIRGSPNLLNCWLINHTRILNNSACGATLTMFKLGYKWLVCCTSVKSTDWNEESIDRL